ncbi:hypothetical protein GOBAR_AA35365 [Gossypium barbadense]|uniref:Uncharacterized protein n=1 Tax=Gossypium barbadense TaxID=3634 RepID=A0A2P5W2K2_GOSBA|nr:hypothetical protein GOBAR_AA35365 [Gossypium barbadense]
MRVEEDTLVVVEVVFHNHSVQRRGYRGGRAGLGSHKEPFPMELQAHPWSVGTIVSHTRVNLAVLPTTTSHGHGNLSDPVLGKHFCYVFKRSYCTAVFPPVVCARPTVCPCV